LRRKNFRIITYLEIENKQLSQTLMKKTEEIFVKKYLEEKDIITKDFEVIKVLSNDQLDYLDRLNCIIHCSKCKDALHTCGLKLILYGDYVYCLSCMKVYNEKQVNMYCDECDIEYYTQLREIIDYNLESYFQVSISNYHCKLDYEEKIICPKCEKDLYADINSFNNSDKIEEIICINCNLIFDVSLFKYKCKKCGTNFKSDAKIYNSFYNKKNDLICKVHTLSNKKFASPQSTINKGCDCNLNYIKKYKHFDGGVLYLGERNGLKIILCDKCYKIFDYYNFIFSCPLCNKKFNSSHIDTFQKVSKGYESSNFPNMKRSQFLYDKEISRKSSLISLFEPKKTRTRKLLIKENNNSNRPNSKFSSMQQTKRCDKCKCSLIKMPNEKRKNIIKTNPFSTRSKKLKNNNNNKPNKTLSETSKDKAIFKRKIFIQPSKKKISQKINIRIQNFYNNYTPIIHIVEKKAKSKEKLRDFKYILKRNYTTDKKLNRTIIDNQKNISGALKGRIIGKPNYCLDLKDQSKRRNLMKDIEYNYYSYNNSIWDSKKKYTSSLIEVSTSQKSNDYGFNKIFYTNNLNKDRKLVHSSDKDKNINKFNIKNTNIKINNKNYNKLNASEIIKRNINLEKQNIVELKKEDNKNKKKKIKADKFIKLVNNYINITSNKSESNKQINKLINLLLINQKVINKLIN